MLARTALALLLLSSLTACKKKSVDPDFPRADAGPPRDSGGSDVDGGLPTPDAGPPLPSSGLITAAEGGALASDDGVFALFIPPGALAADTEVSITTVEAATWPAETTDSPPIGGVYDIQPEGLTFSIPAYAIHRFEGRAPELLTMDGEPSFAFHYVRSADGTLEIVPTETYVFETVSGVVAQVSHLSSHWASRYLAGTRATLTARVVAEAGRHAVDSEWFASHVSLHTSGSLTMVQEVKTASHVSTSGGGYVVPVSHEGWSSTMRTEQAWSFLLPVPARADTSASSAPISLPTLDMGTPYTFPMPLPGWRCVAPADPGTALISISVTAWVPIPGTDALHVAHLVTEIGTPDCILREEKPEYVAQRMTLGDARIMPIAVPADVTRDISMSMGSYGYLGTVPAGRTIRVCVTASMPTSVTYYPRYHPGYMFRDVPPPGCTEITNIDGVNPNDVLIVLEGAGSPNDVTVTTTLL